MVWLVLGPSKYSIYTAATISWGKSWPTLSLRLLLLPPLGRLLHFGFEWAAGSTTNSSFRYSLHPPVSSDDALFSQYGCENILLLVSFHQYTVNMVTSICRVRLSWWWSKTLPNSVVAFTKKGKVVHSIWQQTPAYHCCLFAFLSWNRTKSGWEGRVCNRFPTLVHAVTHATSAVLPSTLTTALWLWGFR